MSRHSIVCTGCRDSGAVGRPIRDTDVCAACGRRLSTDAGILAEREADPIGWAERCAAYAAAYPEIPADCLCGCEGDEEEHRD